ncbi:hypothetical protein QBC45DRAFT_469581 [Copromyces sp. CBS 386.78]|nr:hypothetical protein QBC45DRAFT_469581 [Copromyces sp. CBS 386.78]
MSSAPTPSLLGLPVELRLQIYQHIWTIPHEEHILVQIHADYSRYFEEHPLFLKTSYLKSQLSAICTLGAISQQMRNEAYAEYFHTTQIYLGWGFFDYWNMGSFYLHDKQALELIRTSYLLQTQARHICLHWADVPRFKLLEPPVVAEMSRANHTRYHAEKRMSDNYKIAMECLETRFPNAITLDVICDVDPCDEMFWEFCRLHDFEHERGPWGRRFNSSEDFKMFDNYYGNRASKRIRSLPFRGKLEKAVVRPVLHTFPRARELFKDHEKAAWFRRFQKDVATLAAPHKVVCTHAVTKAINLFLPPGVSSITILFNRHFPTDSSPLTNIDKSQQEGDKDRSYIIKNHIGGLYLAWPRSYKI